jgi:hypothetical protein
MRARASIVQLGWAGTLAVALAAVSQTAGCWPACPEPEPFESGDYVIVGLAKGNPRPEDQWLVDTVTGAQLTVDREASEATIRYTKDGTTYEVHYTLESDP